MTRDDVTLTRAERVLVALPRHEPRQVHAGRLRARCHERLARHAPSRPVPAAAQGRRLRILARSATAAALGHLPLATVVRRVFQS